MNAPRSPETTAPGPAVPRAILLILLAAAALRLGLWLWFAGLPPHIVDEKDYSQLAGNLLEHGEFAFHPGYPTSLRPPLYPTFVAFVYAAFGVDSFQAVRLCQALLGLLNVWLVYLLGREVFSQRVGLLGAGLLAFYPTMVGTNNLILTETLFTLLLTAACYAVVLYFRREAAGWMALAGLLLGLAALTRSVVWLSPPFLAVYVLLTGGRSLAHRALAASLLVLTFAATLAPWTIRNTRLQGTFVTIDTMGGRNFMMGNYRHTPLYRAWDAVSLEGEKAWSHEVFATYPPAERPTQGRVDKLALRQGLKFVRENPSLTALRDLVKLTDFWGLERELVAGATRGYFGPIPGWAVVVAGAGVVLCYVAGLFLGVFGALLCPPADRRIHWLFLLVIAFVCALHTLVFGHSRYHLPLMPLVLLYAAAMWAHGAEVWKRRPRGRLAVGLLVCLGFSVGWAWSAVAGDWGLVKGMLQGWL